MTIQGWQTHHPFLTLYPVQAWLIEHTTPGAAAAAARPAQPPVTLDQMGGAGVSGMGGGDTRTLVVDYLFRHVCCYSWSQTHKQTLACLIRILDVFCKSQVTVLVGHYCRWPPGSWLQRRVTQSCRQ